MLHQLAVTTKIQLNISVGSSSVLFFPSHMKSVSELTNSSQTCWNTIAFREWHLSSALVDPTQVPKQMLIRELVPQHLALLPLENCHWLCQNCEPQKRCNSYLLPSAGETDPWGTETWGFQKFHSESLESQEQNFGPPDFQSCPLIMRSVAGTERPSVCTRGSPQGSASVGMGDSHIPFPPQVLLPHASRSNLDHTECIEVSFYNTFGSEVICRVALAEKSLGLQNGSCFSLSISCDLLF